MTNGYEGQVKASGSMREKNFCRPLNRKVHAKNGNSIYVTPLHRFLRKMKVLALIRQVPQTSIVLLCSSGGKDSTFNMMKCIQEGHEIIALGNMYPSHGKGISFGSCIMTSLLILEELDSYMYQSVGHDAIEAVAECLELPLYRRQIKGRPANLEYDYQPTEEDEVEDLYELVKHVKVSKEKYKKRISFCSKCIQIWKVFHLVPYSPPIKRTV